MNAAGGEPRDSVATLLQAADQKLVVTAMLEGHMPQLPDTEGQHGRAGTACEVPGAFSRLLSPRQDAGLHRPVRLARPSQLAKSHFRPELTG